MHMSKLLAGVALSAAGVLGVSAQAHAADVQWSITFGSPYYLAPAPVYVRPTPIYLPPQPVYWGHGYQHPRRWDRDGDGIPNRYDRHYNPRWDRDGDGVPNRFDRHPNYPGRHGGRGGYGWQDGRGGNDWQGGHGGYSGRGGRGH
jgi:hypothetical protein